MDAAISVDADAMAPAPPSRRLGLELVIVTILGLAMLLPGVWRYSLVDPWESHYGEVSRRMLQDHDWVHTDWQKEGFRSKPVLTFWLMAASMKVLGVADDGGYSGEMPASAKTLLAIRLPFVLFGVMGLVLTWLMLARLVSRRVAWLGLLVVGTTPFYLLVARQGITDMTLVACMMGAISMFVLATEDGERPIEPLATIRPPRWFPPSLRERGPLAIDARHVLWLVAGGFVAIQAAYYLYYFTQAPQLYGRMRFPSPAIVIPLFMVLCMFLMWSRPVRWLLGEPKPGEPPSTLWRVLGLLRITRMRQVYFLWFYVFLAISLLGKGLPALGIIGIVNFLYVALLNRWRDIWDGRYELKRGIFLMIAIAVPWHLAMYLKDGPLFIKEYFVTHLWNRAAVGVFGERGTFDFYLGQLGYGMFLWAALLPAALAAFARGTSISTREGRVRFVVGVWAIATVAFFALVQTKFHHYILPAVPALGLIVAFWIDDVWAGRSRIHVAFVLFGAGIVLVLARDMMFEEKQWIEMFVFRYDRPWPTAPPWSIDTTDGFLALGLISAGAILLHGLVRGRAIGVAALAVAGLSTGLWSIHVYMPIAGQHWGMRDAMRTYYVEREIHGQRLVYFGGRQLADDWAPVLDRANGGPATWTFQTFIPDKLQVGKPMTIRIQVNKIKEERVSEVDVSLIGTTVAIGEHSITVELPSRELAKIAQAVNAGRHAPRAGRKPVKAVDGDRLIIWQGYWRGEVFWSGDEIGGWLPEYQTDWQLGDSDSKKFLKYLNDRSLAPPGRRYFILSAGSIQGVRSLLPTARAKDTFEVLDTTSNKFALGAFIL
jgi:4-amino-4-deoxy-L-arabinose transferase-like glycosyltransferase